MTEVGKSKRTPPHFRYTGSTAEKGAEVTAAASGTSSLSVVRPSDPTDSVTLA